MIHAVKITVLTFLVLLLTACSGAGDSIENTTGISVSVRNSAGTVSNTFSTNETATIVANLRDANGVILENETILFSTTSGTLAVSSSLSNVDGQAQTSLFLADATPGVITITISATVNDETITATANINVSLPPDVVNTNEISATLVTQLDGETITTAPVGASVTVLATVTNSENQPVAGEIVSFSTNAGSLSSPSRLTSDEGTASVILNMTDADVGVATITAVVDVGGETVAQTTFIDITAQVTEVNPDDEFEIGALDGDVFEARVLYADDSLTDNGVTTIGAGASFGVSVTIYNQTKQQPVTNTPFEVSFTSTCVAAEKATIDATVFSIQGTASATYQDVSCAGATGNEDNIVATVSINSTQYIASRNIQILPEALGSIEFVSAQPESIVLKGVGGVGKQEYSELTFLVKGKLGNPQPQREVSFTLSTDVGGLSLISQSGFTNAQGLVTATVVSGTAPTPVRVTATVISGETSVSTQSDLLSVNTGLPDQNSFTLSFSTLNPEATNFVGEEVQVTAYLADSFNNPVPNGTTVNFTTEGGAIEPSCNTLDGRCTVVWNSQAPYTDNHRVTLLATAVGHEYFADVDGNNFYSDGDGVAIDASGNISSGYANVTQLMTGFIDMSEAWRDDNENYSYDIGEQYIDDNNDGQFNVPDMEFNGPQCNASVCSEQRLITIRKSGIIVMSGSNAYFSVTDPATEDIYLNPFGSTTASGFPASTDLVLNISDSAQQTLPAGTNIYISTISMPEGSEIPTYTIGNSIGTSSPDTFSDLRHTFLGNQFGGLQHVFNTGASNNLYILVTTPYGIDTTRTLSW